MNAIEHRGLLTLAVEDLDTASDFQKRRTPASEQADQGLRESIHALGLLTPILVHWNAEEQRHQVVDGHRRVAAARALGIAQVPAMEVAGDARLSMAAGVAANRQREPLEPVDMWRAMVDLHGRGWTTEDAAAALGISQRLARKLDKLGRLHPDMLALIEQHGLPPHDDWLGCIAAAPPEMQAAALNARGAFWGRDKAPNWYDIQAACRVQRIPRSRAIFDADASGLVWEEDLFAQPDDEDAITTRDVAGFLERQLDALRAKALRVKKLHLAEWDPKASGPRLPAGWQRTFEKKTVGAERYTAVVPQGPNTGDIIEIYAVPPAPKIPAKKGDQAGARKESPVVSGDPQDASDDAPRDEDEEQDDLPDQPAPPPPPTKARGPLTEKGRILVAAAKTTAIRCALRDRRDHSAGEILRVLVLALSGQNVDVRGDPASAYTRVTFTDLAARLVDAEGAMIGLALDEVVAIAAEAAARIIVCGETGFVGNSSGPPAEWIGALIEAHRDMPRLDTPEILATVNAETLQAADVAAGNTGKGSSKAIRERLAGNAPDLVLPGSAFGAKGPPRSKTRPKGHVGPFPCVGCNDPEGCIGLVACERAGDEEEAA